MNDSPSRDMPRRDFVKGSAAALIGAAAIGSAHGKDAAREFVTVDDFDRTDSLDHGTDWETLNPGYWKLERKALRRRLRNVGDRARSTGFPYHWETHRNQPMPVDYDPSLPFGMIWRRDWFLEGNYAIRARLVVRETRPDAPAGEENWKQHQPGYALMGVCFGAETLMESWNGGGKQGDAAWMAAWRDDGHVGVYDHATNQPKPVDPDATRPLTLQPGDPLDIEVRIDGGSVESGILTVTWKTPSAEATVRLDNVWKAKATDGYIGIVGRGLLDFEVQSFEISPGDNIRRDEPVSPLHVAYPLGDTLQNRDGTWSCRFVCLLRENGEEVAIRVSTEEAPSGGWANVPVAASAPIVNNDFRRNTAVVEVPLPASPEDTTLYYTVWKDGVDATHDPRPGFLQLPRYVGRLPQLKPPYRLAGLSCHAIHGNSPNLPRSGRFQKHWVHDQPTPEAYRHLEEFDLQVMMWEDDIWYLELLLYPPSTDDAYKIVTTTLAGPTTRWQMMRHWNVLNPGDHDHGMDDVKGPEQIAIRNNDGLGQDAEYMQRNFCIVSHLVRGDEQPDPVANPKRWRRWTMPGEDFTLYLVDSRLWRSSQDTRMWDDQGWGHERGLYHRDDPTRALLGEEQFAWLTQNITTDTAPLICVTGINGLHTIWNGVKNDPDTGARFDERDRVAADYAGWVKAGVDRVLEVLSSRGGVVSVYGDVHVGSIVENVQLRQPECSFGPIGRTGGRAPKPGFGPHMEDYDGREVAVHTLYHNRYQSPTLEKREGPQSWNFLEADFDPRGAEPRMKLAIRNLIDTPDTPPRGGPMVERTANETGREPTCRLPELRTLPSAAVRFTTLNGRPLRGTRSLDDGTVPLMGLNGVSPGEQVIMTAVGDEESAAEVIRMLPT